MTYKEQAPRCRAGVARQAGYGPPGRIEIRSTEMEIWFKISSLTPLIPGVYADDRLVEERYSNCAFDESRKPLFIEGRSGARYDQSGSLTP